MTHYVVHCKFIHSPHCVLITMATILLLKMMVMYTKYTPQRRFTRRVTVESTSTDIHSQEVGVLHSMGGECCLVMAMTSAVVRMLCRSLSCLISDCTSVMCVCVCCALPCAKYSCVCDIICCTCSLCSDDECTIITSKDTSLQGL